MGEEDKQEEQKEVKRPEPVLPVRVVARKDGSALVEWMDGDGYLRRAYIPEAKVKEGPHAGLGASAAPVKVLEAGIPYGLPWEKWIEVVATPEDIANELRRQGVWCWEDMNNAALDAANRAFDRGAFLRRVQQEVKK